MSTTARIAITIVSILTAMLIWLAVDPAMGHAVAGRTVAGHAVTGRTVAGHTVAGHTTGPGGCCPRKPPRPAR